MCIFNSMLIYTCNTEIQNKTHSCSNTPVYIVVLPFGVNEAERVHSLIHRSCNGSENGSVEHLSPTYQSASSCLIYHKNDCNLGQNLEKFQCMTWLNCESLTYTSVPYPFLASRNTLASTMYSSQTIISLLRTGLNITYNPHYMFDLNKFITIIFMPCITRVK